MFDGFTIQRLLAQAAIKDSCFPNLERRSSTLLYIESTQEIFNFAESKLVATSKNDELQY